MSEKRLPSASSLEKGPLGILHLVRFLEAAALNRDNALDPEYTAREWHKDRMLIDGLGIGLEQTLTFVYQSAPSISEFENWMVEKNGGRLSAEAIAHVNRAMLIFEGETAHDSDLDVDELPALSESELQFWREHGYVIVSGALPPENCRAAASAVWEALDASPDDPETWYRSASIMVPLYRHPALDANRDIPRIKKAFAQIWGTDELFVTCDRVSFNPPQRPDWAFPGPDLHWDVELTPPVPFGVQGLLYLTDTPAEQGAFTCVPGFHHRIDQWLAELPAGADPQQQDLHALGPLPIAGEAGDLVIWHQALPHGSRPNLGAKPRLVQYIKMYPIREADAETREN